MYSNRYLLQQIARQRLASTQRLTRVACPGVRPVPAPARPEAKVLTSTIPPPTAAREGSSLRDVAVGLPR
jgi:hypothetical protein